MLGYIGQIIGLIGALVGLVGNKWDEKQRGWRRLTPQGRIALVVILIGTSISLYSIRTQEVRNRRLQAAAAADLEEGWKALVYPFTLMLWEVHGTSVGYDLDKIKTLLDDPSTIERVGAIDIRGEAPHYSGPWRKILGDSSRTGKEALKSAGSRLNIFLDDNSVLAVQHVLACRYLDVLTISESFVDGIDAAPEWTGRPYPMGMMADRPSREEYIRTLIALREEIDRHLPHGQTR